MPVFKGGYYIDEIYTPMQQIVGEKVLNSFYEQHLPFQIQDLAQQFDIRKVTPLSKVVWNMITRGRPTRASLKLSEHILKNRLGADKVSLKLKGAEAGIKLNWPELNTMDETSMRRVILTFGEHSEQEITKEFGKDYVILYQILKDLQTSARLQQLLLLLYFAMDIGETLEVNLKDIEPSLAAVIVDDLNELFRQLNHLLSDREQSLTEIVLSDRPEAQTILYENEHEKGLGITSVEKIKIKALQDSDFFLPQFMDRSIQYKALGLHTKEPSAQQEALQYLLKNIFRKTAFRPGQEAMISRGLRGMDVLGMLPGGGGKTLVWQLCSMLHPGVTMAVEPLQSVMKEQVEELRAHGIDVVSFHAFTKREEQEQRLKELGAARYRLVYCTADRLQNENFRTQLQQQTDRKVFYSYVVIDEAHCVSEWGHDFRYSYVDLAQNLKGLCKTKNKKLVVFALTATASYDVQTDILRELEMTADAPVSLSAKAIDRKELSYQILKVELEELGKSEKAHLRQGSGGQGEGSAPAMSNEVISKAKLPNPESSEEGGDEAHLRQGSGGQEKAQLDYAGREQAVGKVKYPRLKETIEGIPEQLGEASAETFFKKSAKKGYANAGVVFGPTKSDKDPNGVLSLAKYLHGELKQLDIATFLNGGDEYSVTKAKAQKEATHSLGNQESFMEDKKNLMVTTRDFGVGLHKANIRYTCHYSLPDSLESFYQQAGRAGRDGKPALCTILYSPEDIHTNYEFFEDEFHGISREKEIIDEFLTEVRYEEDFFLSVIDHKAREQYPEIAKVLFWKERYLYVLGSLSKNPRDRIQIASIDLEEDLALSEAFVKNFDAAKAKEIGESIVEILKEECPDQDYLSRIQSNASPGIKLLMQQDPITRQKLRIAFTNNAVNALSDFLKADNPGMRPKIIRAAIKFCKTAEEFVDHLKVRYLKHMDYQRDLEVSDDQLAEIRTRFEQIRNEKDTLRAIHRLSTAGVIDEHTIDYAAGFVTVKFQAKSDEEYYQHLERYLRRYLGHASTQKWMKRAQAKEAGSAAENVLYTLIEFIDQEIAGKRKRAMAYMQQLCEVGHAQGQEVFREHMVYYFSSKYARPGYLPRDTDGGKIQNMEIVKKYIELVSAPPDGLGSEMDNAKHLRGACEYMRSRMSGTNASLDLLSAYGTFASESPQKVDTVNAVKRPLTKQAMGSYREGFKSLEESESWSGVLDLMQSFNGKVLDINPATAPVLDTLRNDLLVYRTSKRLKSFLNKIS